MEDFKNRLLQFIESSYGMSQRAFEELCGIAQGTIASIKVKGPSVDVLMKISNTCPELNMNWLISGREPMLNTATSAGAPAVNIEHIHTINIGNWSELVDLLRK